MNALLHFWVVMTNLIGQATDPLGTDTMSGAVTDAQGLITGTYAPVMVGAIIFGVTLGIAFRWLRRGIRTAGAGK